MCVKLWTWRFDEKFCVIWRGIREIADFGESRFFWYYWLCCCSKGKLPYASQLNSKSKNKTLTKIPRKTCLKSLQFALSFCKLCLIFGLWLWHLHFGTSIGRNFGPIQRKFDVIFWWLYLLYKWVCYYIIGICSTNIGFDYYISEMSAMNLLKLWKCERNIDFDVKFYTLYRKVKGNLSMIIVIDITCMYISTYVVQCGPSMMLFLVYDATASYYYNL